MKKVIIIIFIIGLILTSSFLIGANDSKINLNGYRIYVDPGHGGKDNGANYNEVLEDEINLKIANYLVKELVEAGANVYTSRSADYDLASNYDKNRKNKDLRLRTELINTLKPDLFLSIHLNAYASDLSVHGGQLFAQNNEKSKLLAEVLQEKLNGLSGKSKKYKIGDYYLLNKTKVIGVIVECGFLSNDYERGKLNSEEYQRKIALELVKGVSEYFYKSS